MIKKFEIEEFELESGEKLKDVSIAYHTFGKLNKEGTNVVWVFHALTADSNPKTWWKGVVGENGVINEEDHFIVCANILGSCYGTTGPLSVNPATKQPYYYDFPLITIRDIVKGHQLLKEHLKINQIYLGIGGSMGGSQLLEWTIQEPELFDKLSLLATSPKESPWGIATHSMQRKAIETDITWGSENKQAGLKGLQVARGIGMLSYRSYASFEEKQKDELDKVDDFKASSYLDYQGKKFAQRFNAFSYYSLSKSLDTHNISRNRKTIQEVLKGIKSKSLIIGISSDMLCPVKEQAFMAESMPNNQFVTIDSDYGHDGFLVESEKISKHLKAFLNN